MESDPEHHRNAGVLIGGSNNEQRLIFSWNGGNSGAAPGVMALAATAPDGLQAASVDDHGRVSLWAIGLAANEGEVGRIIGRPVALSFSPDGTDLLAASGNGAVEIWARETAGDRRELAPREIARYRRLASRAICREEERDVVLQSRAAGRQLVVSNGRASLRDLDTGKELSSCAVAPAGSAVRDMTISAHRRRILAIVSARSADRSLDLITYDISDGKREAQRLVPIDSAGGCVRASPDGRTIIVIDTDRIETLSLNENAAAPVVRSTPLSARILAASFSRSGKTLAVYEAGGAITLFQMPDYLPEYREPIKLGAANDRIGLLFDDDDNHLIALSEDRGFAFRVYPSWVQLEQEAKRDLPSCISVAERTAFSLAPAPPDWCIALHKKPYDTAGWRYWLKETRAGRNPPLPQP